MDLFVSYKNVGKFYKDASSLTKICLEKEQGARTTTQKQNVLGDIDVGNTLGVLGATAATAAATAVGFAGYNYWKNYERKELREVYKKLLKDINNIQFVGKIQQTTNYDQLYHNLKIIENKIIANPISSLNKLYGEFPNINFKIDTVGTQGYEVGIKNVIDSLNGLSEMINETYGLKYAKLNFCKTPKNIINYIKLKDNIIITNMRQTASTVTTATQDAISNSRIFLERYKDILNILIGERYEALSTCIYESEEVPKDSNFMDI
jgi:hypothetical protein